MNARENADFIELPGVPADVLNVMASLQDGLEAVSYLQLPTCATNRSAHAVNTLRQCASAAIYATMCSFINSTEENAANEKPGR